MNTNVNLMSNLDDWARTDSNIEPSAFGCQYYISCNDSARGSLGRGTCTQMSYIGRHYGEAIEGSDFRLAIVGIDHGEKERASYVECRDGIENCYQIGGYNFNADYKGISKVASAIFGRSSRRCNEFCSSNCTKNSTGTENCVIDRIARPNIVKCVRDDINGRSTKSTWTMRTNCSKHLIDELEQLKPNLIVFFHLPYRDIFLPLLQELAFEYKPLSDIKDAHGHVIYEVPRICDTLLFLAHPAHGQLGRQWHNVVVPSLNYLREGGRIPA